MDIKYLHTLRTVIQEGSFSKAAEKLNYTQSTITFHIDQLEREFSVQLFEKIGRRMVLTKAGEQMLPYIDSALQEIDKLYCIKSDLRAHQGELRVGVGETLLCYKLPGIVKEFTRQAPKARLHIRSMNCYDIRDAVQSGELDLGIFYEDVGGIGDQLVTAPMGSFSLALAASPDVKGRFPDFVTPGQQISVPFLINEQRCIFRQIFENYLAGKSINLDRTIELWSIPTIKNLVKSGMGVTFLPYFAVEDDLAGGSLAEIPTDISGTEIHAVCCHHKNKWISPLMQLFIDLCAGLIEPK